jgi:hypothetical protein
MNTNQHEFISIVDLGMAYRKAKVDIYYSTHAPIMDVVNYEENLYENLKRLYGTLQNQDNTWANDGGFLGDWVLVPKGVNADCTKTGLIYSDQQTQWNAACENKSVEVEFRLTAQPSLDFHVLSALWIAKVGHKYDSRLADCAFGNRLRRKQNGEANPLSLGSFTPYMKPFREWRDNGICAMRKALDDKKKIVAITADVSSFYHELNPDFMLNEEFLGILGLEQLSPDEKNLTRVFIQALKNWAKSTPLKKGLPVGLPASAIVANMALVELDFYIQKEVVPLYYGRYVDDIILVMENGADFSSTEEVWEWLFARSNNLLNWKDDKKEIVSFSPVYLADSTIEFSNKKNKVFIIEGESGATLIDSLSRQIHERASEWRALPNLPRNPAHVATDLLAATQRDGEAADNLRKADALTMRRAGFAIKLRDFEAYERDLPPNAWAEHRHAFLNAFIQHVLVLPAFFEFAIYLPRIIRMATACEDFFQLRKVIEALHDLVETVKNSCAVTIKSCDEKNLPASETIIKNWKTQIDLIVEENIKAAFPPRLRRQEKQRWKEHLIDPDLLRFDCSIKVLQDCQKKLYAHDLAHIPFRFIWLPKELVSPRGIPAKKTVQCLAEADKLLERTIWQGLKILGKWVKCKCNSQDSLPYGLLFATRPFNLTELYFLIKDPFTEVSSAKISQCILALRGFSVTDKIPRREKDGVLVIPDDFDSAKIIIALASWKTDINSWAASVTKNIDPDTSRYQRMNYLINALLSSSQQVSYFIMPELSMPANWFMRIAQKLQGRGVSFITGIEYQRRRKKIVCNQVWAALTHDGLGFPSMMIYRQDKQHPALHEEQELQRLAGLVLKPDNRWKIPPVICHGNFHFAMLVCSELSNIAYRSALRGRIDAILVPEWNQDTETFNDLVKSAAMDIHAYIVQCNDRQYGDSRIRAPYKDSWKRDLVRIKGGKNDYFVIGEIDIRSLRQFQSSHRSPIGPFKPVPDGFDIDFERRTLPQTGEQG